MPDWALMHFVERFPDGDDVVSRSLAARWSRGDLSRKHVAELCRRFLASPSSVGLLPPIARPKWPVGLPVVIRMAKGPGGGHYFQFAGLDGHELWSQGDDPMLRPPVATRWGQTGWADERGFFLRLPPAQPGLNTHALLVEQNFNYGYWQNPAGDIVWSQRFSPAFSFQGVDTVDECLTPIDTPQAREHVRRSIDIEVMPSRDDPDWGRLGVLRIWANADLETWPSRDYSVACRINIECNGQVIASFQEAAFQHDFDKYWMNFRWEVELASIPELAGRLSDDGRQFDLSGLVLRVIGDGELALQDLYYDQYWSGEITIDAVDVARVHRWL